MSEPFKHVDTQVQIVWEILDDQGRVWTFCEAPTAVEAVEMARQRLREHVVMWESLVRYCGSEEAGGRPNVKLASVRRRTSVTMHVYTTEYSDEQSIAEVEMADA